MSLGRNLSSASGANNVPPMAPAVVTLLPHSTSHGEEQQGAAAPLGSPTASGALNRQPSSHSDDDDDDSAVIVMGQGADGGEGVILTPSRLRTHSLSVMGFAVTQFLLALFVALLLIKLDGTIDLTWWIVFMPLIASSLAQMPISMVLLMSIKDIMSLQVGPPPPANASVGLHLQYELILQQRTRSHICEHLSVLVEGSAHIVVEVLFVWALSSGKLDSVPLRVIFAPAWVGWGICILLNCMRDRTERSLITLRDLMYIFLIMVAFKVDDVSSASWRVIFIFPWIFFAIVFMLGAILLSTLLVARAWTRWRELLLPISFCGWLLSNIGLFAAATALVQLLDGDDSIPLTNVLVPAAVALACMSFFTLVLSYGLHLKERVRALLLAMGAVWTAHETIARRLHTDREAAQRHIDSLPEEEVARMVAELMAGKSKPTVLLRVGATLYKRVPDAADTLGPGGAAQDDHGVARSKDPSAMEVGGGGGQGLIRTALDDAVGARTHSGSVPLQPAPLMASPGARQPAHLELTPQPQGTAPPSQEAAAAPLPGQAPGADAAEATGAPQAHSSSSSQLPAVASPALAAAPPVELRSSSSRRLVERPSSGVVPRSSHSLTVHAQPRPGTAVPSLVPHAEDSAPVVLGVRTGATTPAAERSSATVTAAGGGGGAAPNAAGFRRTSAQAHPRVSNSTGHGVPGQGGGGGMGLFANSALAGLVDGRLLGMQNQNQVIAEDANVDDTTCVICFDRESSHVFLDCGHSGFCGPCARLLFVRPPNECPSCRRRVTMVVELESRVPVGQLAKVKQ